MRPSNWLDSFLEKRKIKKVDGISLYKYHVSKDEYISLCNILQKNMEDVNNTKSYSFRFWAACFCLFVSEWYRRDYNANWAWSGIEEKLRVSFTPNQHKELVCVGIEYWKRPLRTRGESNNDYLGSLFLEGGLPWPLVREGHHFGRIINKGIRDYSRIDNSISLYSILKENEYYLPLTFRNDDTRFLLEGIIEILLDFASLIPPESKQNPFEYLDVHKPTWRTEFPIPLDEENAETLVDQWLVSANRSQKNTNKSESFVKCDHFHIGSYTSLKISTKIIYPRKLNFSPLQKINSSRFEMQIFEGKRLIKHEGIVYGELLNDTVEITISNKSSSVQRIKYSENLSVRLFIYGQEVGRIVIPESSIHNNSIITFEEIEDKNRFVSDCSCMVKSAEAIICVPKETKVLSEKTKRIGIGPNCLRWIKINDDTQFERDGNTFSVKLNSEENNKIVLTGNEYEEDTIPSFCFRGFPRVNNISTRKGNIYPFFQSKKIDTFVSNHIIGSANYTIEDSQGVTIFRKRVGILPCDFKIIQYADNSDELSYTEIYGISQECDVEILENVFVPVFNWLEDRLQIKLKSQLKENIPGFFTISLKSKEIRKPVKISVPYPRVGVELLDTDNKLIEKEHLSIDELLGMQLKLISSDIDYHFHLELELFSNECKKPIVIIHRYKVNEKPLIINLYSLKPEIEQLISIVLDQDAYVKVRIYSKNARNIFNLNIRQYSGFIRLLDDKVLVLDSSNKKILDSAKPVIMRLNQPSSDGIPLNEILTQGVGTGTFSIRPYNNTAEPILILPQKESNINFRPKLFCATSFQQPEKKAKSLYEATVQFHPQENPTVIDDFIEEMKSFPGHKGWNYFKDILEKYIHISFSSFEVWNALVKNMEALATAIFRLDFDEDRCNRLSNEVSVIWECIPVDSWRNAYKNIKSWYAKSFNFSDVILNSVLGNRVGVMNSTLSTLQYINEYICNGTLEFKPEIFFQTVINDWYQQLMCNHHNLNDRWPTGLNDELELWSSNCKSFTYFEKQLLKSEYQISVCYLPLYMARVTLGYSSLENLSHSSLNQLKFQIKKISDYDNIWYKSAHAMMVYYLLQKKLEKGTLDNELLP